MTNQEQLIDKLLALQGLGASGPSETQVAQFRQQLTEEERRAKRLARLTQIPLWLWAGVMLGLCMSEQLWSHLQIPFAPAWLVVMFIMAAGGFPILIDLGRQMKQSQDTIKRLKRLMPDYVPPTVQVGTLLARVGSKRYVHWLKLLCFAVIAWGSVSMAGAVVRLALTQSLTMPSWEGQTMMAIFAFIGVCAMTLRAPLDELPDVHHISRFFWWPVPDLSVWRMPRPVWVGLGGSAALICMTVAVFLIYQENTLYARVLRGFERANSFHVQSFDYEEGQPVLRSEIWYLRWHGTRIQHHAGDTVVDLYDNGRDQWQHTQGSESATVMRGQGSILPGELTETARYLKRCERTPAGDKVIDGDLCSLYQATHEQTRSMFWVDDKKRFRRYEEERLIDGQWQAVELGTIQYEADLDPNWVTPQFEPSIEIIEPGSMLETRYRLDTAIASKEIMGLDFAVHEVQRHQGNLIVTCSVRPTEESLQQIDAAGQERHHPTEEYGSFQMTGWWRRKPNGDIESRHYAQAQLGRVVQNNVYYCWYAMRPTASWPGFENRLEVCGYVHTRRALAGLRKQQNLKWYGNIRPILTIDLPEQEVSLDVLSDDLHSIQREITGLHLSTKHLRQEVPDATFRQDLERDLAGLRPYRELWEQIDSETRFQFLDPEGQPVVGAHVGIELKQIQGQWKSLAITDDSGTVVLEGSQFFSDNTAQNMGSPINAVHPERGLAATYEVTASHFGKTTSFTMVPACRVTARYECKALASQGQTLDSVETDLALHTSQWDRKSRRLLTRSSYSFIKDVLVHRTDTGRLEAWLVPGQYELRSYAGSRRKGWNADLAKHITVPKDKQALDLGELELTLE